MHVPKGSIYGFVGRNGAGKTTLILRISSRMSMMPWGSRPFTGSPSTQKADLCPVRRGQRQRDIAKIRRRMGAVVETPSIYLDMTARDNLREQYQVLGLPDESGRSVCTGRLFAVHNPWCTIPPLRYRYCSRQG
mgnify:CR=1 FL=1